MYDIIWNCKRCEIVGTKKGHTMCPCPRGGCEAYEIKVPKKRFTRKEVTHIISVSRTIDSAKPEDIIDKVATNLTPERELWDLNDYEKTHRMQGYEKTKSPYMFSKAEPVFIINGRKYSQNEENPKFLI